MRVPEPPPPPPPPPPPEPPLLPQAASTTAAAENRVSARTTSLECLRAFITQSPPSTLRGTTCRGSVQRSRARRARWRSGRGRARRPGLAAAGRRAARPSRWVPERVVGTEHDPRRPEQVEGRAERAGGAGDRVGVEERQVVARALSLGEGARDGAPPV